MGRYSALHASSAVDCVRRCFIKTGLLRGVGHLLPGCWVFVVKVPRFPYLIGTDAPSPLVLVERRRIDRSIEAKAHATMSAALKEQRPTSRKQDR